MLLTLNRRWQVSVWYGAVLVALFAWVFEFVTGTASPLEHLILAALSLTAVGFAAYTSSRDASARHLAMRKFLETLCREDVGELTDPELACAGMTIDPAWDFTLARLAESISERVRRASDADHARASAEVRTRRTAAQRDQLRDILHAIPEAVIVVGPYDEVLIANPAAQGLLGIKSVDDSFGPLQGALKQDTFLSLLTETRKRNSSLARSASIVLTSENGIEEHYKVVCRSLGTSGESKGALPSVAVTFNDISALKALQSRNAEFVSSVSHEMKTPLAGIKAYVELLSDGDADDEATRDEFLGIIKSQADRLQRLVENLLNLARIEAGVVKVNKRVCSLNEVVQEAFHVLAPTAELKNIKLSNELSSMYLGVFADHDTLLQATINLGSNAIKYTPDGGKVTFRTRIADHEVSFEVEDTGVGLNEQDRLKVFEKFYRVKKDSEMAPGTGLGLPLVKHIIEDVHGGRIEVESELGKGSTFRMVLPGTDQIQH